jgi:hypothetical protein
MQRKAARVKTPRQGKAKLGVAGHLGKARQDTDTKQLGKAMRGNGYRQGKMRRGKVTMQGEAKQGT